MGHVSTTPVENWNIVHHPKPTIMQNGNQQAWTAAHDGRTLVCNSLNKETSPLPDKTQYQ